MTDRQQVFVKAAMEIVGTEGYNKCTIRNVAARVGVTEPAVYRHFKNKVDLLTIMLQHLQTTILPVLELRQKGNEGLEEVLDRFAQTLFTTLSDNPELGIFLFFEEVFHHEKELKPVLLEIIEEAQKKLSRDLATLQEKKLVRSDLPSQSLGLLLIGTLRLMIGRMHMGHTAQAQDLASQYVQLFLVVLRPQA